MAACQRLSSEAAGLYRPCGRGPPATRDPLSRFWQSPWPVFS